MSTTPIIDDIRFQVTILSRRVAALERKLGKDGVAVSEAFDLAAIMPQVRAITQDLFPGPCEFTHEFDPEYPEDRYVVVKAEATGDIKEIVDREELWHKRVRQLWPDLWDTLCLFVVPR
jgi:hypothetical protein